MTTVDDCGKGFATTIERDRSSRQLVRERGEGRRGVRAVDDSARFFRGSELPRLLILGGILTGGLVFFWHYYYYKADQLVDPEVVAVGVPAPVERAKEPEFEGVTDKTEVGLRDQAAYMTLLEKARRTRPIDLDKEARRDVLFTHLWDRPEHYRGVPVHLLGTARRIVRYDTKKSKTGWIYEAWVFTSESQRHPYCCVSEEIPEGMPIGDNISERVTFNGYFLKLMKYQAVDVTRAAPLLIGRIGWKAPSGGAKRPAGGGLAGRNGTVFWMALAIAAMFVISLMRWLSGLRRSLRPRRSVASMIRDRPNEEIDPESLAQWVESAPQLEDEPEEEGEARRP